MNRRTLFKSFLGGGLATTFIVVNPDAKLRKYGLLTVAGHRAHRNTTGETLHVFYEGRDITSSCYEADDNQGYAKLFCRDEEEHRRWDADGAKHINQDKSDACRLFVRGDVVIIAGSADPNNAT